MRNTPPPDYRTGSVILYDGDCRFCLGLVRAISSRDRAGQFRFASLRSGEALDLLRARGLRPDLEFQEGVPATLLVVDETRCLRSSDAALAIARALPGGWRLAARVATSIPKPLRDWGYRLVARNRYRWFGRADACPVPGPQPTRVQLGGTSTPRPRTGQRLETGDDNS